MAARNKVRFEETYGSGLPEVYLDPAATNGVLTQLLEAAIRFSPEGGVIEVRTAREPGSLTLEIRDHGYGIPEDQAAGIFSLFGHNLRESHQSLSGLGLGLYLVKRIVELHGGSVTASTSNGAGVVFALRFPLRSEGARAA
jgi:signal transduction histidine kinase